MAINERLIHTAAAAAGGGGTGNQEEGLILHLDASDVDSYDGDGSVWYDITNHEYTPAVDPAEHFNTVTYTGTGANQSITGFGFNPDLIWVKRRDSSVHHHIFDTVRGNNALYTSLNYDQDAFSSGIDITSSNEDGFDVIGASGALNTNNGTYVAWGFKAGGTPTASKPIFVDGTGYASLSAAGLDDSTNTNYTSLELSVNTDLGFSIVTANAPINPATARLPHGLGQEPEMVIHKALGMSYDWAVWHKDLPSKNHRLRLNEDALSDSYSNVNGGYWTGVNSTDVMYLQDSADRDQVYYSFVSKRGVSKVGSYTGTGTSGNKVYTGFEPAWVMVKKTSTSGNWIISDQVRGINKEVYPNLNNIDNTDYNGIQSYNADGFTLGTGGDWNQDGQTFIYLAFAAEKPSSLIDDTDLKLHLDAGDNTTVTTSTWTDLTANSYDGNFTNFSSTLTDFYEKEIGNFITFDGTNDYVKINNTGLTKSGGTNFTVEAWARMHTTGTSDYIVSQTTDDGNSQNWLLRFHSDNKIKFYVYGADEYLSTSSTYSANVWYHIVGLVESNGTVRIYVNGELKASSSSGKSADTVARNTFIGGLGSQQTADADIGQVRIYHTALTADEVMQNYRFTKNDYPNGKHATITSASWASEGSFSFQNNQYATIPVGQFIGDNDQIKTITAWVKADTTSSRVFPYTISSSSDSNRYFTLGLYNDLSKVYCSSRNGSSSNQWQDNFSITPDTSWHHIAVTFDGTTRRLYFDGDLQTSSVDNRGTATSSSWITYANIGSSPKAYIGRGRHVSSWYSDGKISDIKLLDRALTDDEIEADYNKGQFGDK